MVNIAISKKRFKNLTKGKLIFFVNMFIMLMRNIIENQAYMVSFLFVACGFGSPVI